MNSARYVARIGFLIGLMAVGATPSLAAPKKDPAKEALRRMQLELQQVRDEKQALAQQKAAQDEAVETLKKDVARQSAAAAHANRGKAAVQAELEMLREEKSKLATELAHLRETLQKTETKVSETEARLGQETTKGQQLSQSLADRGKSLTACQMDNQAMYRYHVELLNLAQQRGSLSVFLGDYAPLGWRRVEIENLMEAYRDKFDERTVDAPKVGAVGDRTSPHEPAAR